MAPFQCQSYTFDPRPRYPFLITAKRYWSPAHQSLEPDALTVVFAHATGHCKECWEPTIEDLYDVIVEAGNANVLKIREFWSIDAPNHGEAAILNEELLSWGHSPVFDWQEYARSLHAVLTGLGNGIDTDFRTRRLVGVGHSMGAPAIMLADTYMPEIRFESIVLVDPMMYKEIRLAVNLIEVSSTRRDIWPNYEEAYKQFRSRKAFKAWDPRVLDIYLKYCLRELPSAEYPNREGVTLTCTKEQELSCYRETVGKSRAYTYLRTLCAKMPVHFIFGAINDIVPATIQDTLLKEASNGQYATASRVDGAGHLVVQVKPRGLAEHLYAALQSDVFRNFAPGPVASVGSKL